MTSISNQVKNQNLIKERVHSSSTFVRKVIKKILIRLSIEPFKTTLQRHYKKKHKSWRLFALFLLSFFLLMVIIMREVKEYGNPPIRVFFRQIRRSAKSFVQIRNHNHIVGGGGGGEGGGDRGVRNSRLPYTALPLPVPLTPTSRPSPCCSRPL